MQISKVTIDGYSNNYSKQNEQNKTLATPVVQKSTTLPNYQVAFGLLIQSDKANQYKAMRKELEDHLKSNPNLHNYEIQCILQHTNEQNIAATYNLLKNDPNFPKDSIADILCAANEQNISLAQQLFAAPEV